MLLTVVLLRGKDFVEMEPLKETFHNKIYTVVGYTINQITCDDNGAYGNTRSVRNDYCFEEEEDGKLIVNIVYKKTVNMYSMLEMSDPTINFLLNRPECTLSKDIIEEIKVSLV